MPNKRRGKERENPSVFELGIPPFVKHFLGRYQMMLFSSFTTEPQMGCPNVKAESASVIEHTKALWKKEKQNW